MKIMKKRSFKVLLCIIAVILGIGIAFGIYTSNYYHAVGGYQNTEVDIAEYEHFTIYGNSITETGIIFYPGGKVEAKAYEPLLCELAEKGICCVLVDMPFHLAVFDKDAAIPVMEQISTVNNWYLAGHSLGGAMAASCVSDHIDEFAGLILLAAYPTEELPTDFPVLSIYGSEDGVLNREKYAASIGLATNLTEVIIEGGNHAGFGNYGFQEGDNPAAISNEEQWEATVEGMLTFINELD